MKQVTDIGAVDATDPVIMGYARAHDFVVLTQDLDFGAILAATNGDKPSVVQIRAGDTSPEAIGTALVEALQKAHREIMDGALLTIDPGRSRLRVLPLRS